LTRVGEAPAGGHYPGVLGAGQAVRIFTGGPVPEGADAVIIQEDVDASSEADGADIVIKQPGQKGQYIRPAGLDFSAGSVGLPAGRRLTARDIGLAAAMDHPWLTVRRKPRIAVLASGDEIVRPGEPIGANQIVSSNSFALAATITAMGGEPVVIGIAPDDSDGLRSAADAARGCDMLVTTGGASVGQHDLIQTALSDHADGQMPMLGLPGNPVSTLVCAQIFLRPAIERMLGIAASDDDYDLAILGRALPANDQREDYLRCQLQRDEHGKLVAWPFERQDSSMLSLMSSADCLLVRQPFDQARALGDSVRILHFGHTAWRF
jgi:molybdopterin molybdotransferase